MFVAINENNIIIAVSRTPIQLEGATTIQIDYNGDKNALIGKKMGKPAKETEDLKVAFICNYGDNCGIATYSRYLINALGKKVNIKIFAEDNNRTQASENVVKCWKRGESMVDAVQQVLDWQPDLVHIQHEFGLFPNATKFLKMLEMLNSVPYVLTLHSVYEHLDKTICTAYIKNIIVHSQTGLNTLRRLGHDNNRIDVITHGCVEVFDNSELWNIFHNEYSVIQFGFGFNYKGVDQAIDAIHYLKKTDIKFKDIFYCYMCSENDHTMNIHEEYYTYLKKKIRELDLNENVVILRGYLSDGLISNFLRTAKLAIFPYKNNPNNVVYGASGAIRVAMANAIPIIGSDSHMFDDLEGVIPRIDNAEHLAVEIDKVFSNVDYKKLLVQKNLDFVKNNNWHLIADKHIEVYKDIVKLYNKDCIMTK